MRNTERGTPPKNPSTANTAGTARAPTPAASRMRCRSGRLA